MDTELTLLVKTELQYDYGVPVSVLGGGTNNGIALTLDTDSNLIIYMIKNSGVVAVYQSGDSYTVEDTRFPTSQNPLTLRVVSVAGTGVDYVIVATASSIWVLKTGTHFPYWQQYSSPNLQVTDAIPSFDSAGTLRIAATIYSPSGRNYLIYLLDTTTGMWTQDTGVHAATTDLKDVVVDAKFASAINSSLFGYYISGNNISKGGNGVIIVTGGTKYSAQTFIAAGNYNSLAYASVRQPASQPLLFAVEEQTQLGWYFQAQKDGTYSRVSVLGTTKLQNIKAALRVAQDLDGLTTHTWIELFALDTLGNMWHQESDMSQDPTMMTPGLYAVTKWRDPAMITRENVSLYLTQTPDGFASPLCVKNDNSLALWAQDPTTSDWTNQTVSIDNTVPTAQVQKRTVYYVEITAFDGNNLPNSGLTAILSSSEYTTINVNGLSATIDPVRKYTANTNTMGRICFTYDTPDTLAAPTISLWVEGMDVDHVLDVQPSGDITAKFKAITADDLKGATNQITGLPILPNVDDKTLDVMATALVGVMDVVDPDQLVLATHDLSRKYLHSSTSPHVSRTRSRSEKSMGRIRGQSGRGVHIVFASQLELSRGEPALSAQRLTADEARKQIEEIQNYNYPTWNWSFGDLAKTIANGLYSVVSYTIQGIQDGLNVLIQLYKDGKNYIWNGIVNFVRQAFDFAMGVFNSVGCFFSDLFDWLAYMLDWGDIKQSAETFKTLLTGFQDEGNHFLSAVLPEAVDSFFQTCKSRLDDSITTAKAYLNGVSIGDYDSDTQARLPGLLGSSVQSDFDSLPSTAMWLLNKLLNGGDPQNAFIFSGTLLSLSDLFSKFQDAISKTALSTDLQAAIDDLGNFFLPFGNRNAMDGTALDAIMDAIKHLLHVVLDLLETLVLLFAEAATQALKLWTQFLNAPVELLAISAIFKEITGTELTCINAVCYAFAVPFTLLFKIFAGHAPFKNVTAEHVSDDIRALTPSDDLLIARGCLQICHAPFDAYVDVIGSILSRIGKGPTRFVNATTFIIPSINAALSYGSISTPGATPQAITNWSISTCGPLLSIVWLSITGFKKGPRGDPDGYSLLCLLGATGFGTGIWHACEPEDSSSKTTALIVAQFLGPLSNCGKVLRAVDNPLAIVGMLVMDIVSNMGEGAALIASGLL